MLAFRQLVHCGALLPELRRAFEECVVERGPSVGQDVLEEVRGECMSPSWGVGEKDDDDVWHLRVTERGLQVLERVWKSSFVVLC